MQPNASTITAENQRKNRQSDNGSKHKVLEQRMGTIVDVHKTLPMVTVVYSSGAFVAGGAFIGVSHSVLDIIHRFGKLRPGLRVKVSFVNEMDSSATCEIIGIEDERLGAELQQINNHNTPLYEIFSPGL